MSLFVPAIETLGRRIVIFGPSNAGKSTLAAALGHRLGIPVVHLDLLRHLPDTNWQQRPDAEFNALHDAAIIAPEWVMEGNYSELIPPRLARATGVIALDEHLFVRYRRYFRRTLFENGKRTGGLEGNRDSVKWNMIHWLWHTRNSAKKYNRLARESGLPFVLCSNGRELDALYSNWSLRRPAGAF